jgi:hypothetical protein
MTLHFGAAGLVLPVMMGVGAHVLYFQRYEYHRHLYNIICLCLGTTLLLPFYFHRFLGLSYNDATWMTAKYEACFLGGALISTLIYRLLLNPLNRFPGPFWARMTDFWLAIHVGKKLDQYRKLERLHQYV